MPNIDQIFIFWISVAIAIAGVGSNAAIWGGALPADYIPILASWNKIISTMGQVVMPLLLGQGMTNAGRLANAAGAIDTKTGQSRDEQSRSEIHRNHSGSGRSN